MLNDDNVSIYKLFVLLRQTTDAMFKGREKELKEYGITPQQAAALIGIRALGNDTTPAEISRWVFREANSVTILLRRMENQGLINKRRDSKRKNITRISLTAKGQEAYRHATKLESVHDIIFALSKAKRQQLWSLLEILRNSALEHLRVDTRTYSQLFNQVIKFEVDDTTTITRQDQDRS
jgi:DNA-binding MarR family transcriptional regulator